MNAKRGTGGKKFIWHHRLKRNETDLHDKKAIWVLKSDSSAKRQTTKNYHSKWLTKSKQKSKIAGFMNVNLQHCILRMMFVRVHIHVRVRLCIDIRSKSSSASLKYTYAQHTYQQRQ